MYKRIAAIVSASTLVISMCGCGSSSSSRRDFISGNSIGGGSLAETVTEEEISPDDVTAEDITEETETIPEETEAVTEHVSPREVFTSELGTETEVKQTIPFTPDLNTVKVPLSKLIEEGDRISSFDFEVYSADGSAIGTYKGGFGISVSEDCPAGKDGWYQSPDFEMYVNSSYADFHWDVPAEIRDYIHEGGDVMIGYWWGGTSSVTIDCAVCTFTRSRELPVDGSVDHPVGKTLNWSGTDNTVSIKASDILPEGAVPQVISYKVTAPGGMKKFVGFGAVSSSLGYSKSVDAGMLTDGSQVTYDWYVSDEAKNLVSEDGEIMFTYGWSEQPTVTLDSVTVVYSIGDAHSVPSGTEQKTTEATELPSGFRSAKEISSEINVGWNLGNTLECYNYSDYTSNAETAWGNLKTTEAMVKSVKDAGFNSIRIPVTWGEHMDGDTIDREWLDRVQEVVDYAYDNDMFVILNMHHDDYIWFTPSDADYASDSSKLKKIWEQISARFGDYGDRLIFEGMNEPRTVGSQNEWMGGTSAERSVLNKYTQDFVDTVRASGGNNAYRTLMVPSYAASAETAAINDMVVPSDSNIIVSVHYYAPWKFSEGKSTTFGDSEKAELDRKFAELKQRFIDRGTPVIIDEFGCINAADAATRASYYEYYIHAAKAQGIKCFVWDNGVSSGSDSYGIFNRGSLKWDSTLLDGIMKGAN